MSPLFLDIRLCLCDLHTLSEREPSVNKQGDNIKEGAIHLAELSPVSLKDKQHESTQQRQWKPESRGGSNRIKTKDRCTQDETTQTDNWLEAHGLQLSMD